MFNCELTEEKHFVEKVKGQYAESNMKVKSPFFCFRESLCNYLWKYHVENNYLARNKNLSIELPGQLNLSAAILCGFIIIYYSSFQIELLRLQ